MEYRSFSVHYKPHVFADPDKEDELIDLDLDHVTARSTPITRDEITFDAGSPSIISNGKLQNGHVKTLSPDLLLAGNNVSSMRRDSRRDSGIALTEKTLSDRPMPRIGLNPSKESMVIFNGDEKVVSGNDTRVVPNTSRPPRTFHLESFITGEGPLTLIGLEEDDVVGELSPRESHAYPSLPREKSNLMPPIETTDPEKDKGHVVNTRDSF